MNLTTIAYMKYGKRLHSANIIRSISGQYMPPTPQMIIAQQKKQIKTFKEAFTVEQRTIINQIIGIMQPKNVEFSSSIGKHISQIEQWAASLYESKDYKSYKSGLQDAEAQKKMYKQLLFEWQNIIKLLEKYSNNDLIKQRIDIFNQGVMALQNTIKTGIPLDSNIISKIIWAGTTVKGYYLEEAGKEFIAEELSKYDIETIQAGQMKAKRANTSSRVDLAQDIIVIPRNKTVGKKTLGEFLQDTSKQKTIYLEDKEYQDLITRGLGIQAKASRKGLVRIKNTGGSMHEYLEWGASVRSVHADLLKILAEEVKKGGIRVEHPDYAAIANYIFSHHLAKNLHSNAFYLLRDGLYDTYSMLETQLNKGNYVRIINNKMHLINGSKTIGIYLA